MCKSIRINYKILSNVTLKISMILMLTGLAQYTPISAKNLRIVPINWTRFTAKYPTDYNANLQKSVNKNAIKYAVNGWYSSKFGNQSDTYLNFGGTDENNIRPNTAQAIAIATSVKLGIYDAVYTGVSKADAIKICAKLVRSVAYRHCSNTSDGWGNSWQSAHWAGVAGVAGWMILDQFNDTDKEYIRKMIEYESNRFIDYRVPYYKDRSGTIISPGDTKAEENAWNSICLHTACCMMPNHPNYDKWYFKAIELDMSAWSRPDDLNDFTIYHGKPVNEWLLGTNVNNDGTVINHSIIYPDYMCASNLSLFIATIHTLAGKSTPKALMHGIEYVYKALTELNFTAPPYLSPGGTIYKVGTYEIYYPKGNDWGTSRYIQFGSYDAMINAYGKDNLVEKKGSYWEPFHMQKAFELQSRTTCGSMFIDWSELKYNGREEQASWENTMAILAKWTVLQDEYTVDNNSLKYYAR